MLANFFIITISLVVTLTTSPKINRTSQMPINTSMQTILKQPAPVIGLPQFYYLKKLHTLTEKSEISLPDQRALILQNIKKKLQAHPVAVQNLNDRNTKMLLVLIYYNMITNLDRHCILNLENWNCAVFKNHVNEVLNSFIWDGSFNNLSDLDFFVKTVFEEVPVLDEEGLVEVVEVNRVILVMREFFFVDFKEKFELLLGDYRKNIQDLDTYLQS